MSDIKMLIQKLAGTYGSAKVKLMDVTVRTVDRDNNTCIVDSVDGTHDIDGLKVRLALEVCDGNLEIPEEKSTITIAFTDFTEPYMVTGTWLKEKDITVGDQGWKIIDKKQVFNSEKYGGIPIVKDPDNSDAGLLARINKIEEDNKDLKKALQDLLTDAASCVTGSPGSPDAFAVKYIARFTAYPAQPLVKTTEDMIASPSIFHGKKIETS